MCFSKNKLPVLIPNHRNLSIAACRLKYDCIFLIQGILVQIPYLCLIYTVYGRHIRNQLLCNVLCLEVKMLLQDISDYLVHQTWVKSADNGIMREPVLDVMCSL